MATQYNRIMPGKKSCCFKECLEGEFIGGDWGVADDLTKDLSEDWHDFNAKYISRYLQVYPEASRISAGLACGMLWTICNGLQIDDVVLMPDGNGQYAVGKIVSEYYFAGSDKNLPHRRRVKWFENRLLRSDMSVELQHSSGSIGTCCDLTKYAEELERLLKNHPQDLPADECGSFVLEKHLEDFLIANWKNTEFGKLYDVYQGTDGQFGNQYPTDTGPLDILAISKDKKKLLVVELKRGKTSDAVVGQILRYMSYVKEMLCEGGQTVVGAIVALEDDQKLRRSLSMIDNVSFYRYEISFHLKKTC